MAKFKIGDRVRNLVETEWIPEGDTGIVVDNWDGYSAVEWSKPKKSNISKKWAQNDDYLELITDPYTTLDEALTEAKNALLKLEEAIKEIKLTFK